MDKDTQELMPEIRIGYDNSADVSCCVIQKVVGDKIYLLSRIFGKDALIFYNAWNTRHTHDIKQVIEALKYLYDGCCSVYDGTIYEDEVNKKYNKAKQTLEKMKGDHNG